MLITLGLVNLMLDDSCHGLVPTSHAIEGQPSEVQKLTALLSHSSKTLLHTKPRLYINI
jgi:hypothetical protein